MNYAADVWLNGEHVGSHEGGFTPFSFEITDHLSDENLLAVRVDNERREGGLPTPNTDWFNFGGINRSVELIPAPETYLRNFKVDTALDGENVSVRVRAWADGPELDDPPELSIPALSVETELERARDEDGDLTEYATTLDLSRSTVDLWNPRDPRLYDVELSYGDDELVDRVGLRELGVVDGNIQLNSQAVELRGIAMHEEANGKGRALDEADVEQRFRWLGQLGCNFARLAHYPHTPAMARRADEEGILLWEEVPAYWGVAFGEEETRERYREQLRELIQRDWNRASVALWSIANETDHEDDTRNRVLSEMTDYVRELDDTRLITAACFVNESGDGDRLVIRDPLVEDLDVIGINEYYGWYYTSPGAMARLEDGETPVVVSETGAGAKWGNHGDDGERWTEEFQARIYREQLTAIGGVDRIQGLSPWILFDFRTPMRMNPHQRGYNRKGLLDETGRKKAAFDVLRDAYREWTPDTEG